MACIRLAIHEWCSAAALWLEQGVVTWTPWTILWRYATESQTFHKCRTRKWSVEVNIYMSNSILTFYTSIWTYTRKNKICRYVYQHFKFNISMSKPCTSMTTAHGNCRNCSLSTTLISCIQLWNSGARRCFVNVENCIYMSRFIYIRYVKKNIIMSKKNPLCCEKNIIVSI